MNALLTPSTWPESPWYKITCFLQKLVTYPSGRQCYLHFFASWVWTFRYHQYLTGYSVCQWRPGICGLLQTCGHFPKHRQRQQISGTAPGRGRSPGCSELNSLIRYYWFGFHACACVFILVHVYMGDGTVRVMVKIHHSILKGYVCQVYMLSTRAGAMQD